MNSLMNYGSDGENSNGSDDSKGSQLVKKSHSSARTASETIYDPVPMDMSEESNNNDSSEESHRGRSPNQHEESSHAESRRPALSSQRPKSKESPSPHRDHKHGERLDDKDKHEKHSKHDPRRVDEKKYSHDRRSSKDLKRHRDEDRKSRDGEKRFRDERKSHRSEKGHHQDKKYGEKRDDRDKRREKDKEKDNDRHRDRERIRDRDSKDRDRNSKDKDRNSKDRDRNSKDRDRRSFKDEKTRDRCRDDHRSGDKNRGRSRSRSAEREARPFSFRDERNKSKLAQLEKLGIEIKVDEAAKMMPEQNFYNPLATATQGKYAEQIQKRKLLWANKKTEETKTSTSTAANSWVGTTFTHDQDGKVTAKFKRLMGIKGDIPSVPSGQKPDILKKQEEMFSNMEQQYEVARATTHTQRGVGLGYASGSYPFPR